MTFKVKDYYFNKAKKENYLARSIYKLEEIDQKYKIINKSDKILDLGYYPGSWVQYASKKVGPKGEVFGIDIQEVNPKLQGIAGVKLWQKDIFSIDHWESYIGEEKVDVLLSDMAPSTTGVTLVDQQGSLDLVAQVFGILDKVLKFGGNSVIKAFDSNDMQQFLREQKSRFSSFNNFRPKSTRTISKEFFVVGKGFKA